MIVCYQRYSRASKVMSERAEADGHMPLKQSEIDEALRAGQVTMSRATTFLIDQVFVLRSGNGRRHRLRTNS